MFDVKLFQAKLRWKKEYRAKAIRVGEWILNHKKDLEAHRLVMDRQEQDTRVIDAQIKLLDKICSVK